MDHICQSDEPNQLHESDEVNDGEKPVFSLDVCSESFAAFIGEKHQELLNKAKNFAEREIQRFSGRDETLACRYRHLLNYLKGER